MSGRECRQHEVPITSITNGVHTKTWMAPEFSALYTKYLGDWEEHLTEPDFWRGVIDIPDAELWETHQKLKLRLVEFVRERVRAAARADRRIAGIDPHASIRILDPEILTIGFARRFATYKRGALLVQRSGTLAAPAQRRDAPGAIRLCRQSRIRRTKAARRSSSRSTNSAAKPGFENRIVFVEDYDTYIARRLVQGVDLWLNNPLRPLEASGTSGMKLPPNGGLESERARWLVVRKLQRQEWLGDRR